MTAPAERPLRADARRNREAILAAARTTFEADGILAPIDGIATAAGVGNATFYRNFPTRDDLLVAVIDDSVRELLTASTEYESGMDPESALHEWLYRLAWQLRIWQNLPTCIASAIEDATSPVRTVCARLTARTDDFLARARGAGVVADGITAGEVFELVTAASWAVDRFGDDAPAARQRVRLATAGVFRR